MLKTIDALMVEGWEALVKNLGPAEATRYLLQFQAGAGDYTKSRHDLFENVSAAEIIHDIRKKYPQQHEK